MGDLEVCDEGLQALAGHCVATSGRLASQTTAPIPGPPTQATSAAVRGAYTALGATATVLAARVQATGEELSISAARYVATDENSAQRLAAL